MLKNVQMLIKMEPELHDQFMVAAANTHTPAAQVVRQLMRRFIANQEIPNAVTVEALQASERGEGARFQTANELFKDLGI